MVDSLLKFQGVIGANIVNGVFVSCKSVGKVLSLDNIVGIGDGALSGQDNLVTVKLGSSINSVGRSCFANCHNLKEIIVPRKLSRFEDRLKSGNNAVICYKD